MTAKAGAILVVTAIWLSSGGQAAAQVWTVESDRAALGLSVGKASANDSGHGGTWNATFELPTIPTWRLRADVGRVHWRFDEDMRGRFPQRSAMTRASVTAVRTTPPAGVPVNMFAGGGVGVYWYPAPADQGFTRFGFHGLVGLEVGLPGDRTKIVGELRVDALHTSGIQDVTPSPLQGSAVLGVRWMWRSQ
jgi:hypothetical protein